MLVAMREESFTKSGLSQKESEARVWKAEVSSGLEALSEGK